MSRIAVTGHVHVSGVVAAWVATALEERLRRERGGGIHGITCLAEGSDQIFARVVLALGGTLEVVLPARDYLERILRADNRARVEELLSRAGGVRTMPFDESGRDAYLAASEEMLRNSDLLLAVWDGRPSRRRGDTADVVAKARERHLPIEVFWPEAGPAADSGGDGSITIRSQMGNEGTGASGDPPSSCSRR